ncbi:MAG TPA: protein kinase [Candidatus Polarisedimenticolaceae bacterium]
MSSSITPGTRLGPYEIVDRLGAGGMGEVWRAKDSRLGRDVAIKVLPPLVAADAERLQRFHREAQVLASLNHPNVGAIYGVEEIGGSPALVLELIEGPTLADRISKGPLLLDEAVAIARQIADALEYAHDRGVVHRDLKPANVKLDAEGRAKVLDFGLAKAVAGDPSGRSDPALSMSPTITSLGTMAGALLGTAAYMSPEQARGASVDRRADIWAFGALFWEMLTGKRLFEGETVSDTLAAVLRAPVEYDSIPPSVPPSLRRLIARCLDRDPKKRLRDIGEARILLENVGKEPESEPPAASFAPAPRPRWFALLPWTVAAASVAALVGVKLLSRPAESPQLSTRFEMTRPAKLQGMSWPMLAPDGRTIAFQGFGADGTGGMIWIRPLDAFEAYPLSGTEGAGRPFWSPDSRHLAFFASGQLRKIPVAGGPTQMICECTGADGSWGIDGTILFDGSATDGIRSVPASGGVPTQVVPAGGEGQLRLAAWPRLLPDGRHFLFLGRERDDVSAENMILVGTLGETEHRALVPTKSRVDFANGRLVYILQDTLVSQRLDMDRLEVRGDPVPIVSGIMASGGRANFSLSARGDLVYMAAAEQGRAELVWVDRSGKEIGKVGPPDRYLELALSPDGTRVAYGLSDDKGEPDVWVRDLRRNAVARITNQSGTDNWPVWSADGTQVYFASNRSGAKYLVYRRSATGTGPEDVIFEPERGGAGPADVSTDGRHLTLVRSNTGAQFDIVTIPADGKGAPVSVAADKANEGAAQFSPDGRFIAYSSDESGRTEIYVQTFPPSGQKWTVSNSGGFQPRWRADGRELFYLGADAEMTSVPLMLGSSFEAGLPETLFGTRVRTGGTLTGLYDVTADGQRFLLNTPTGETAPTPFSVVLNAVQP